MKYLISLLLISCFTYVHALEQAQVLYAFDDPIQARWFQELSSELRCPQCQNQNILDSNASIALDLRAKTYELLQQGYDKDEVVTYMTDRYGQFITYSPSLTVATLFLWLFPLCIADWSDCIVMGCREKSSSITFSSDEKARLNQIIGPKSMTELYLSVFWCVYVC